MNEQKTIPMDDLSFDAKVLAGAWFGMGMKTTVTLHLVESQPTKRTQDAIDELVSKGVMGVEPFNDLGGLVHRPLVDCSEAFRWLRGVVEDETMSAEAKWPLYEAIDERGAYERMTPYGKGVWDGERKGAKPRDNPYDRVSAPERHACWEKGRRNATRR